MKYLLLVFLIPIIGFSQNTRKVFVESGVTSFIPFVKEERSYGNFENQYFRDLKYTYKTTPGYFIKCGIEILPKTERRFTVTVPLSIGYKEFNKDMVTTGYAIGCFSYFNGTEKNHTSSKAASLMIGPKFNFSAKKLTVFTVININTDLFFLSSESYEYKSINGETYRHFNSSAPHVNDLVFSTSLQLGFDYKMSSRWSAGFSSDCYFLNPIINSDKLNSTLFNFGYSQQSTFVCIGIRVGYHF